jgi:pimeloyl-ACP methyl ester carboxylesterase
LTPVVETEISLVYKGIEIVCDRVTGAGPGVVYFGGYASDRFADKAEALWQWSIDKGRSFLRFDYSGHGESGGLFKEGSLGLWLEEGLFAVESLTSGPQILVGSSMGGWASLIAAMRRPDLVGGLVTVACAADFTETVVRPDLTPENLRELEETGHCEEQDRADGPPRIVSKVFLEEARNHLLLDGSPIGLSCPVRLIHGLADQSIPWQTSLDVVCALTSQNATLELIPGSDHRLSTPKDMERILARVEEVSFLIAQR